MALVQWMGSALALRMREGEREAESKVVDGCCGAWGVGEERTQTEMRERRARKRIYASFSIVWHLP